VIRRIAGMVVRPRTTLAEVIQAPAWVIIWAVVLLVWLVCGGALLSTEVGRQALIDERVRAVEAFGGSVSDAEYAAMQVSPPWWVYFTSGGRLLLAPPVTVLAALGILLIARADGVRATLGQGLAIAVHATVALLIGQLVSTPLHYLRESLTSPLNLAAILPLIEEGTIPARFFGTIDLFALWWIGLLALGLSVLTQRRPGRYLGPLLALYVSVAAVLAAVLAVMGGA
jgi:hypothetical protein